MLRNIQPEAYHRKAKSELQDIRHNLKLLNRITQQLDSMDDQVYTPERQVTLDKSQKLKINIREKLKSMGINVNEMVSVLDYKINILSREFNTFQKMYQTSLTQKTNTKINPKAQDEYKYQINQLEERIFELQKKQNEYVKQISQFKEKNAKLREQFTNLSFDSNQRIKELSEKLHNNTSPNLTIKRAMLNPNPQSIYLLNGQENDRKKGKNNFVKIKGGNNFEQDLNPLEMSPVEGKRNKNLLQSMTSESSEFDIKGLGYEIPENEQNSSSNLKFGCFPGKQVSQKTKTGSSSQNKKVNFEQKRDKSRRFEFLLNNLVQKKGPQEDNPSASGVIPPMIPQNTPNLYTGNNKPSTSYQTGSVYQYKGLGVRQNTQQYKSVFNQNLVRRYQI